MGYSYNVLSSMLFPLIVVLAIADDVHIMQHWDEERPPQSAEEAFKATVAHLATPLLRRQRDDRARACRRSPTEQRRRRPVVRRRVAVGIMVDFMISLVFVPTLLSLMKPEVKEPVHERYLVSSLRRIAVFSTSRPRLVLAVTVALALVAAIGIRDLRVDTNHISFFSTDHPLGQSARVIDDELSGVYSFQILLEGPPESLGTPQNLPAHGPAEKRAAEAANVKKVRSVADYVRRVNKELTTAIRQPPSCRPIRQWWRRSCSSSRSAPRGGASSSGSWPSDYSRAQIDVKLKSMDSYGVLDMIERSDALGAGIFKGSGITATTTGSGRLFSTLDHYLVASQISSFGTAFITGLCRDLRHLPVAQVRIPDHRAQPAPGARGAGRDGVPRHFDEHRHRDGRQRGARHRGRRHDSFHQPLPARGRAGAAPTRRSRSPRSTRGRASLTTAVINSLAFGVLLLSEYKPTAWFGGLLALTMVVAFLAEVFILPATIKLLPRLFRADALRRAIETGP
jgi:predicted RND superfamily exporter protein